LNLSGIYNIFSTAVGVNPKYSAMNLGTGSFPDDENQVGDWPELGYTIRIQKTSLIN